MRVLFLSRRFFPAVSGMSVYAANLLPALVARGHEMTMLSQFRGDEVGTRVYGGGPPPALAGVRVRGLESVGEQNGGDFERDVDDMIAAGEEEHARRPFDLVHAQYGYPPGLAALELGRRLGLPTVVSIQGGDGHWVGECCATHREAMATVLERTGEVLIGSASFEGEVRERFQLAPGRFTIVPGGVDLERFRPRQTRHERPLRLLYHGRIDRRKGVLDLLEALALLGDDSPWTLRISGRGPDVEAAARRVVELGLEARVVMTGPVDYAEVPGVYGEADAFASPTHGEGFSNTILEAMASGLPVVASASVGVVDCLRHDGNALLAAPHDIEALAAELARLGADRELRERLRERALSEVRALYAWPAVAAAVEAAYERAAQAPVDGDWTMPARVEGCRYRAEPHLL